MAAHQAPLSLGFSRQEPWSGVPFPSSMQESEKWEWGHSVVSDPQRPHGLQPSRLFHPWDSLGKSTGVGCRMLGADALEWPREMVWGGRWEGGSGLGTIHPWRIHVDVWQNQYNIVKWKKNKIRNKIKFEQQKKEYWSGLPLPSPHSMPRSVLKSLSFPFNGCGLRSLFSCYKPLTGGWSQLLEPSCHSLPCDSLPLASQVWTSEYSISDL